VGAETTYVHEDSSNANDDEAEITVNKINEHVIGRITLQETGTQFN